MSFSEILAGYALQQNPWRLHSVNYEAFWVKKKK
jgi:hypothetical protein